MAVLIKFLANKITAILAIVPSANLGISRSEFSQNIKSCLSDELFDKFLDLRYKEGFLEL